MATVIDQFIVKYTLDTKDLDKGLSATEKKLDKLKKDSAEAGSALSDSIGAGAKRATGSLGAFGSMLGKGGVVGLAIGSLIYAGKKIDDKLFSIAQSVRKLGIDSKNFGIAANGMRNLQNASEMAGGSMEDATQTVGELSKSLFDLKFNGQVSGSLVMLARLGVQFQDSYGRARDFNDVMLDTASAIERAKAAGRMTDAEAFQFANQAGFSGGMAQVVTGGRANAERELAKQSERRQVSGKDIAGATNWVRASTSLGQATLAGIGQRGMSAVADARATADQKLEGVGDTAVKVLSSFSNAVESATRALHNSSFMAPGTAGRAGMGRAGGGTVGAGAYSGTIKAAAAKYGIPEDVLTGLLRTESGFNPNAVNARTGARGIAQIMPATGKELGVNPGQDANADINAAAKYLAQLKAGGMKKGITDPNMAMAYAVDAYHTGEGNIARGKNIGAESMAYSGKVLAGTASAGVNKPWMGGGSSNVQIDQITIHTQATDARGIADNIGDLTKRKLMAAQAENGVM